MGSRIARFRLVPKSSTLDDLKRPIRSIAAKMRFLEPILQKIEQR